MTGITRKQAAESQLPALFGTTAVHLSSSRTYDPWEVTDNDGKIWRFVADASIMGQRREDGHIVLADRKPYRVELNSPKLEYSEMGKLQEVVRALRHAGAVSQFLLRASRPRGRLQSYPSEPEERPLHHVL